MFIIVESGSTKADWVVVQSRDNTKFYKTDGINPSIQVELLNLNDEAELLSMILQAEEIYFYGAGIMDKSSKTRIKEWLASFGYKGKLVAAGDMMAAARACFGDESGIVCILGTGSNSCVYNGAEITNAVPSLGFIFSDEGGGTRIGQEVIKAYFYRTMPEKERDIFSANFSVTKEHLVDQVYRSSGGNRYVASFALFLTMIEGEWKSKLLKKLFREFIELRIMLYPEHKTHKLKFVGSIAHIYKKYLDQVLTEYGLQVAEVIQQPIHKLIEFHLNHTINE